MMILPANLPTQSLLSQSTDWGPTPSLLSQSLTKLNITTINN